MSSAEQDSWAKARGWSPRQSRCPRTVAALRCQAARPGSGCVCQVHRRLLDHGRGWTDHQDRPVVTAEPYDAGAEDVAALAADLASLGVQVDVSGDSPYYPGATLRVTITRATITRATENGETT